MTFDWPAIRIAVASLPDVFVLENVSVGLSGARVQKPRRWRRAYNRGIYTEEDFEWLVAGLLPCPRSFFTPVYSSNGELQIIFAARPASIANRNMGPWPGYCSLCSSPVSGFNIKSPQDVHARVSRRMPRPLRDLHYICVVCEDLRACINIYHPGRNLNQHQLVYLDRIRLFYDAADACDPPY